jgi:hypothetical protein
MASRVPVVLAFALALGGVEGIAYWWMHPAPAGLGQPVLAYRPGTKTQRTEDRGQMDSARFRDARSASPDLQSAAPANAAYTPLPEIVAKSLPSLLCSTGTAARVDREDGVTIHLAFFEWELADTTNVLESYRHLPDECMGSIGMRLIGHLPPRTYQLGGETLAFDHTVFRDPADGIVHAFKGTWVSGASGLLGSGVRGGLEQWRQLRWRAGLKRFRPAHARVAQGAVRGVADPDLAWQAFRDAMLVDLRFEPDRTR